MAVLLTTDPCGVPFSRIEIPPVRLDGPGFPVRGVVVMRIFQLDAPTTPLGAGVIDWVPTESGVAIYNLTGVSAGSSYRIALEMIG